MDISAFPKAIITFLMKKTFFAGAILGFLSANSLFWGVGWRGSSDPIPISYITIGLLTVSFLLLEHKEEKTNNILCLKWSHFIAGFLIFGPFLTVLVFFMLMCGTILLFAAPDGYNFLTFLIRLTIPEILHIVVIILFIFFILFFRYKGEKTKNKSYLKWSRFITGFLIFWFFLCYLLNL